MTEQTKYQAYLIRFQRGEGETDWRATLQDVQSCHTLRFPTERELMRYLLHELQVQPSRTESPAISNRGGFDY